MNDLLSELDPVGKLAESFLERYRRGERPPLSEYTAQHPELAEQIEELFPALVIMEELGSIDGPRVGAAADGDSATKKTLQQLGDYRILREVGRGGMGLVFEAVQESLGRHVALKVLPAHGLMPPSHLERFRREARAGARLHHTNIVPIFGVGEHEGVHYYAMQFIQGQGLDEVLKELKRLRHPPLAPLPKGGQGGCPTDRGTDLKSVRLGADRSVEVPSGSTLVGLSSGTELTAQTEGQYFQSVAHMGVQIADALDYAHKQGILHRDIKPSNLLLDAHGTVWVSDFGLAKHATNPGEDPGEVDLTHTGDIVGTLRYMAPERFQGQADARSDVYSLGLTLYELLTLHWAFHESSRPRLIEQVLHDDPPRPRKLDRHIPRDWETIVLKAIEKEPSRRYQTAAELAQDLRRFLASEPIQARRIGAWERGFKWCKRRPAVAALLAVSVAAALCLAVGGLVYNARLEHYLQDAKANLELAGRAERKNTLQLAKAYVEQARAKRLSHAVGQRFASLETLTKAIDLFRSVGELDSHLLELRNEAIACLALPDVKVGTAWDWDPQWSHPLAFDPKMEHYVVRDDRRDVEGYVNQGHLSVRRVADHRETVHLPGFGKHVVWASFSPDARSLAALYGEGQRDAYVWDLERQLPVISKVTQSRDFYPKFSPDSRVVAIPQRDQIQLYDLPSGKASRRLSVAQPIGGLAFHPDGRKLAVFDGGLVQVYATDDGQEIAKFQHAPSVEVMGIAWRDDGKLLATACNDGQAYVWDFANRRQPLNVLKGHQKQIFALHFSHAGDLLVTRSWDGTSRLWNPLTGKQVLSVQGDTASAFSSDDRLLSCGYDRKKIWLWHVTAGRECRTIATHRGSYKNTAVRADISPDGRLLVSTGDEGARLWDLAVGREAEYEPASLPTGRCVSAFFHPDGKSVITAAQTGLQRWPIATNPETGGWYVGPPQTLQLPGQPPQSLGERDTGHLALSPDARTIVVVARRGKAWVFDLENPRNTHSIEQPLLLHPAFSADGRWIATGTRQGTGVKIWEARTGTCVKDLPARTSAAVAFSRDADSQWLAVASGEFRLWKLGTWEPGSRVSVEEGCLGMAFTKDGKMLAAHQPQAGVRLFDPATDQEFATLPTVGIPYCFSNDGTVLFTGGEDQTLQAWDLRLIRAQLAAMGLDWDLPSFSAPSELATGKARQGEVRPGDLVQQSIDRLRAMVKANPKDVVACNNLAWLYATAPEPVRDPKQALALAEKAVKLFPRNAAFQNTLGVACYRNGQYQRAAEILQANLKLSEDAELAWDLYLLAMSCHHLGQLDRARDYLDWANRWSRRQSALSPELVEELNALRAEAEAALARADPIESD